MDSMNFSLNQYPYTLPVIGIGLIALILLFFVLNYIIFKIMGLLFKVNTSVGNDSSKIIYVFSFIVTSLIVFLIIYPYLEKVRLIN